MGPFGFGNLGDAAIQQAMLQHLYQFFPDADVFGFSLNPEDTEKRHGIKCYPIGRVASYGWAGREGAARPWENAQKIAERLRNHSNKLLRYFSHLFFGPLLEIISIIKAKKWLNGMDLFIVSGGGQLDDYWGGPWHHPYSLLLWAVLSKLNGTKFAIVSVGAGPLNSKISQWFDRIALRLADYRSYRDLESRTFIKSIGFDSTKDPVYPDLAQSLLVEQYQKQPIDKRFAGVVGIGPMAYFDPRVWPEKDSQVYLGYLDKLSDFACWLLSHQFAIRLFPGEVVHDFPVIQEFIELLKKKYPKLQDGQLIFEPVETADQLMTQMAQTDVVIASRFHGVLLSQLLLKPVLALSYHQKIDTLMENAGEKDYCLNIKDFDPENTIAKFKHLWEHRETVQQSIEMNVNKFRSALDEQYEYLFRTI